MRQPIPQPMCWPSSSPTADGSGTGLDADLLDDQHTSAFAATTHNHDSSYLGKTAKAADAGKLDGFDATAFVRSVNGAGPDANGNSVVNIDLSSRVAKGGDTITGQLSMSGMHIHINSGGGASWLEMYDDESPNNKKYLHANSNVIGIVGGDGAWKRYVNENSQVWSANYSWLQDRFAASSHSINVHQFSGNTGDGGWWWWAPPTHWCKLLRTTLCALIATPLAIATVIALIKSSWISTHYKNYLPFKCSESMTCFLNPRSMHAPPMPSRRIGD